MTLLEWALTYARLGWPVFPCDPRSKRPLPAKDKDSDGKPIEGSGGLKKATTDPELIKAFWQKWPKAMIGFAAGNAAGVFMFDVDAGPDKQGQVVTLEALEAQLRAMGIELPKTWTVATPRGGRHYYFQLPHAEFGNGKGAFSDLKVAQFPRFDIRGEGGYVILPPSVRDDGATYQWLVKPLPGETTPSAAPQSLLDCIARQGRFAPQRPAPQDGRHESRAAAVATTRPADITDAEAEAVARYAQGALDSALDELAGTPAGARNEAINKTAFRLGQLVGAGALAEFEVRRALATVIDQWPNVAKSTGTIERGLVKGIAEPRDLSDVKANARERERRYGGARSYSSAPLPSFAPPPADFSAYGYESATLPEGQPSHAEGADTAPLDAAPTPQKPPRVRARRIVGTTSFKPADENEEARQRRLDGVCAHFPLTDLGNAERFAIRFKDRFIFSAALGWLFWDGKRWSRDGAKERVLDAEHQCVRAIQNEADWYANSQYEHVAHTKYKGKDNEEDIPYSAMLRAWGRASEEARKLTPIQKRATAMMAVLERDIDSSKTKFMINCRNGTLVIDPRAKQDQIAFKDHDPADLITKLAPVDFDPDAVCPIYDAFLDYVQPHAKVRRFLHQWGGLSLTGDISEQRFAFWWGKGRNGKTTALEAWQNLIGDYGRAVPVETFVNSGQSKSSGQASPELAMLRGIRFCHTNEPEQGTKLSEGIVKLITGGDETPVRDLYGGFFDLRPQFTLTMCGNFRPRIAGGEKSSGIWRRMTLVPWTVTIPEDMIDKTLPDKLRLEAAGILNRLLDGLVDWIENGLQLPDEVIAATEEYRSDSDPLGRFLEACTKPHDGARVQSSELHKVFIAWCKANGEREWTATGFGRAMRERGYESQHSDVNWWLGIEVIKKVDDFLDGDGQAKKGAAREPSAGRGADDDVIPF